MRKDSASNFVSRFATGKRASLRPRKLFSLLNMPPIPNLISGDCLHFCRIFAEMMLPEFQFG